MEPAMGRITDFNMLETTLRQNEVKGNFFKKFCSIAFGSGVLISLGDKSIVVDRKKMHIGSAQDMRNWVQQQLQNLKTNERKQQDTDKINNAIKMFSGTKGGTIEGGFEEVKDLFDTLKNAGINVDKYSRYTEGYQRRTVKIEESDVNELKTALKELYSKLQAGRAKIDRPHAQALEEAAATSQAGGAGAEEPKRSGTQTITAFSSAPMHPGAEYVIEKKSARQYLDESRSIEGKGPKERFEFLKARVTGLGDLNQEEAKGAISRIFSDLEQFWPDRMTEKTRPAVEHKLNEAYKEIQDQEFINLVRKAGISQFQRGGGTGGTTKR